MRKITAYLDLLRAHFIPAWILIFSAGYMTAVRVYGGFEWLTLVKVILIAVFGFEAGMVLNDYVDRDLDKKDVENSLTKYFRPFKSRPLANGILNPGIAMYTIIIFSIIAIFLIISLPSPHRFYVLLLMIYAYLVEYFYQIKKRNQKFPWAQLVGRTDFALFPVAGYLILATPDLNALLYFLYFYPLAEAHLAVNDLADYKNDQARGLLSVTKMYGINGTLIWIVVFTLIHLITATSFVLKVNPGSILGFLFSYIFIIFTCVYILSKRTPSSALKVLPLLHLSMAVQSLSLIFLY
ncbi:MAG: Polyprenyltransferase [Candidatus Shapirobacteria bacterium GW2011_GWE1_38_10]|uniref:Polyprenyltransferase n=1 Tax=Candidatus Shapirobacteria bacterium GW2011_GWE1_38_10 TaxID=1618488 RepID=A0A0G0I4X1_9BACT|nr:MAG: Polyprenyltransferase [Candidatus Shapirobacteria bacterium GW2011_GWF2_37_20]KKQ50383.1 MAG: Polyprenyltransferase [Candidatus Shapirobacteria bacterium GW2011_GWE1_38_10]KKQ65207.1 MAG: Polyprenyltransferase [Candidatus Shapirobacteria bacterium GW2011_GWF1_38_23]HBP51216.1 prenyltransferase [Candidatus Shapirobacteria bacterium]